MALINFPSDPSVNDEYSFEGRTWIFNGSGWEVKALTAELTVGSSDTEVLFNDDGAIGGDPGLTYNKATATLTVAGDIAMTGTGALEVAAGTTAERPSPASNGMVRYNVTLGCLESYVQSAWQVVANTSLDYGLVTSASTTTFDYGGLF